MAFFDDLGKKITGMTDVAKINSAISDENNKIQRNITELGKLYYATYAENCDPKFLPLVKAIEESEKKIAELKHQKQDIKGIVRCTNCSAEIPANSVFCSVCGAPAPVQAPAGSAYAKAPVAQNTEGAVCTKCGSAVAAGLKFCTKCGNPMAPAAPAAPVYSAPAAPVIPEPAAPVIPEPVAPVAEAPAFCTNCGAALEKGMAFCTNCGAKI